MTTPTVVPNPGLHLSSYTVYDRPGQHGSRAVYLCDDCAAKRRANGTMAAKWSGECINGYCDDCQAGPSVSHFRLADPEPLTTSKRIEFDRITHDFNAYFDDQYLGSFPNYHAAECALNDHAMRLIEDGLVDQPLALPAEPPGVPGEDTDPSAPPDLDPAPGRAPDAGAAIYRQFSRRRASFLAVLRGLDRDAWTVLAEAYCAYLLRHGARLTPAHVLRVWSKAVSNDIALPPRVHPLLAKADASAESYAHLP